MKVWHSCEAPNCEHVATHFRRHRNMFGNAHQPGSVVCWTEPTNYGSVHYLVEKLYGPARDWFCADCGKSANEWAFRAKQDQLGELPWSPDPDDYDALCRSCHKRRDWSRDAWRALTKKGRRASSGTTGHPMSNETKEKLSKINLGKVTRRVDCPNCGSSVSAQWLSRHSCGETKMRRNGPERKK